MQRYSVWKTNHLMNTIPLAELKDFPGDCVIHLLDSINENIPSYIPTNNPFLFLSKNKKYLKHIVNLTKSENDLIEIPNKGIYLPQVQWAKIINEFARQNGALIRTVPPGAKDPILNTTTEYYLNYNFLFRAMSRSSILPTVKRLDYVFAGLLNTIMNMENNNHFILFPMPTDIAIHFKKADFDRTFTKIDKSTLKYPDFTHYIFFTYLLNFIHNTSNNGIFNLIPHHMWTKINFIIYSDTDFIIYNLGSLKDLNSGTKLSTESSEEYEQRKDNLSGDRILYQIINQINKLHNTITNIEHTDVIDKKLLHISTDVNDSNTPTVKNLISTKTQGSGAKELNSEIVKSAIELIDTEAEKHIENNNNLSERQKEKARANAQAYKNITLGNKTAEEILNQNDHDIDELYIETLKGKVSDDMLKSKIINFDSSYMEKTFKQDLLCSLMFFNKLGMFVVDIKEEDVSDELNQNILYSVKWTDSSNTSHPPMKFMVPKVDKDGRCYLNGVYRLMKKQRVNNPICKVAKDRIALTSAYNKAIVERAGGANTDFYATFYSLLMPGKPETILGTIDASELKLPYDYSSIGRKMLEFKLLGHYFVFDYHNRFKRITNKKHLETIQELERYGVFCGCELNTNIYYFMDFKSRLIEVDIEKIKILSITTILNKIAHINQISKGYLNEYAQLKILSRNIPLGFVLCYRYGLGYMLKYLNTKYKVYTKRDHFSTKIDDLVIEFKNATLVIPRTPLVHSLIFGGLAVYNLKKYNIEQMDDQDVYFDIMMLKGHTNYLKGVDSFFDLFIGFLEYKTLKQMGEPTNMKDLLIRSVVMLTTSDHKEASSSTQFRLRSYEKYVHIIYNELARTYATWKNKSIGHTNKFSINPYIIQQRIYEDASFDKLDVVNPMHQIKAKTAYSHLGEGGRTADTFMIKDRKFTKDSIGILSADTVDNSSVGINGSLTADPNILNTSGLTQTKNLEEAQPTEILSAVSLVFPALTHDDKNKCLFYQ